MGQKYPNILLILIDSARADHLSCYGYNKETTPYIDKIAQEGIVYKNAFSSNGWTLLAVCSLFTGKYLPSREVSLKKCLQKFTLLSEFLSYYGYQTCAISNNPWVSSHTGLNRGFINFIYFNRQNFWKVLSLITIFKSVLDFKKIKTLDLKGIKQDSTRFLNNEAKLQIEKMLEKKSPFFLYLHHSVHHPYIPPLRFLKKIQCNFSLEEIEKVKKQQGKNMFQFLDDKSNLDVKIKEILICLYDACLQNVDENIGELVALLQKRDRLDDTIIFITADHGEFFGEHGLMSHGNILYEELIKIPLIVKFSPIFSKNQVKNQFVSLIDIFPTICDIITNTTKREKMFSQFDGISLLCNYDREYIIARHFRGTSSEKQKINPDLKRYCGEQIAIRTKQFKFIWFETGNHMLFDLHKDPNEELNISKKNYVKRFYEQFLNLISKLKHHLEPEIKEENSKFKFDEDIKKHLENLGYM